MKSNRFKIGTLSLLIAVCTVACTSENGLPDTPPAGGDVPVGFNATVGNSAVSRIGQLTIDNLPTMSVFAYYTGQNAWNTATHNPDFMYNQHVTRSGSVAPWTYTPVKYWPNTAGDKISFIAYAPHKNDVEGLSVSTAANVAGYPKLTYSPPTNASQQTDLLAATALPNCTKSASPLAFKMKHVLTRVLVNARCTSNIEVTKVKINSTAASGTLTWNNSNTPTWSSITSPTSSTYAEYATSTNVSSNAADPTQIAEFFLLPATATGALDITFTNSGSNGSSTTQSVAIPGTPAWTMGKTIAYTLSIDVGTSIKLSVAEWNTNNISDSIGE